MCCEEKCHSEGERSDLFDRECESAENAAFELVLLLQRPSEDAHRLLDQSAANLLEVSAGVCQLHIHITLRLILMTEQSHNENCL